MSWLEKIETPFEITCGDGKTYTAMWVPTGKDIEYNVAVYEFPKVKGSLVRRGEVKGTKYNMEFYFQGSDHLDVCEAFEESAEDPKPWTVEHPYYGSLLVQPVGMSIDHSSGNLSRITGGFIATITEDAPLATQNPQDKILADKETTDTLLADSYAVEVRPKTADIKELNTKTASTYNIGAKGITDAVDLEEYNRSFRDATKAINNATADPLLAIRQIQNVISAPYRFNQNLKNRLGLLSSQLQNLGTSLFKIVTRNSKKLYENNAGTMISSMMAATITNTTYSTRKQAVDTIDIVLAQYNAYLANLDVLQSINGGVAEAYIPDASSISNLSRLVSYTVSALLEIAMNSRQERTIILEDDTNIFPLASRLYGLKPDDSTVNELIEINGIGPKELLVLKKGRSITYYI